MRHALVTALVVLSSVAFGGDDKSSAWESLLNKRPPLIVATPATGSAAKEIPFDAQKFGKVRGTSPGTATKMACIMVYTTKLDERCIALIRKLDAVAGESKLEGSFVHVFDEKGAQVGGYTADEITARIKELEKVATDNKLKHISLGIAASPSAASQVGLDDSHDVAVSTLRKSAGRSAGVTVSWYELTAAKSLDDKAITAIATAVQDAMKK